MPKQPLSALEKAIKLLSLRALSEAELTTKLRDAGFPGDEIAETIEVCRSRRYIDDSMLAEDYTSLLRMRNTGSRLIRQKLIKRGLGKEIVDRELPEVSSESAELEDAMRALDYKWRMLSRESDLRKKREKAFRYLAGRGFPPGLIFELLADKTSSDGDC